MNCNNTNQKLGFDKFSECNYNLHWSFSNFNRMLMAAGRVAQLPHSASVLEIGAGTSDLKNIVANNFGRDDIKFVRIDGDVKYKHDKEIDAVLDISNKAEWEIFKNFTEEKYDAVVFMEVIEHIVKYMAYDIFANVSDIIKSEGLMLFTTPTPPMEGKYEDRVWPDDHENEFTFDEIYGIINKYFKIVKHIGWSLEEREYNEVLEKDEFLMKLYGKLKGAFPESFIRALIACAAPVEKNRQVLMVCKKRRVAL